MLPSGWSRVPGVWTEAVIWGACRGPTASGIHHISVLPSYRFHENWFFSSRGMDKTVAAAGKRKKKTAEQNGQQAFPMQESPTSCPLWSGASSSIPALLQPQSLRSESHAGALKPPRSSVRSLSCHCRRTRVVSCEDEEFEVGCQSAPSSGGVWRNASWGYIKHWLTLRNHEFWEIQLRNEQNLKLHVADESTGAGGCWRPLKIRPWRGGFFEVLPPLPGGTKGHVHLSGGKNMVLHYFKESRCGHFSFTHWKELPKME